MITEAEQKQFQKFNRVALVRESQGYFRLPDEPPFWILPFLDEGDQNGLVVCFDDPFSFVANFLIEAEEHWANNLSYRISSGVYSVQKGDSPELFYECHADSLHNQKLLLVELLGEGAPGGFHDSIRAIRSGRLAGETALGQIFRYSSASNNAHLNGLPSAEIILNNFIGVVFERYNQLYAKRFLSDSDGSVFDTLAKMAPAEQFVDRIAKLVDEPRLSQWYINFAETDDCFLAEAFPERDNSLRILFRDVTDQYSTARWLKNTDRRSASSGILNSVSCNERIDGVMSEVREIGKQFALISIKIDGLDDVTETYGEVTSAHFVSLVVERILSNIDPMSSVFHFHEDEFVVLLEALTPDISFEAVLDRLRIELNQQYIIGFLTHDLLIAAGMVVYPNASIDLEGEGITPDVLYAIAKKDLS